MPRFFKAMKRKSSYQTRMTWKIPRSSDAEYFKYRFSSLKKKNALNTKIWSTVYGIYASFLKSWIIKQPISSANDLKDTSFFKRGILQILFFKPYNKTHLTQKYEVQYTGNMPRSLFRLFISSECFMIRNWPLYNYFLKPYSTKAFEHRVELK